jgi:lipopolysaccharide export system protein LptA
VALGVVLSPVCGSAQDKKPAPKNAPEGEPINITANRLNSNPDEKYAEFIGNVKAIQADFVMTSKKLRIYYDGSLMNREKQSSNKDMLKKIVATGKVKVVSEQYTAKAEILEYDVKDQILILSGKNSLVTMGKNSITGSKITFYRAQERFIAEGDSVNRVNLVFFSDGKVSDMFGDQETGGKAKD